MPSSSFTPETLVELPSRSSLSVDASGQYALFHESQYSSKENKDTHKIGALSLDTEDVNDLRFHDVESTISCPCWVGSFVFALRQADKGVTELICGTLSNGFGKKQVSVVGSFNGPVKGLHSATINKDKAIVVVKGQATSSGKLHNPENVVKPTSSGREYSAMPVRFYQEWYTAQRSSVFAAIVEKPSDSTECSAWAMKDPVNLLKGTKLCLHRHGEFMVSKYGVALVGELFFSKRGDYFASNVVFVPIQSIEEAVPKAIVHTGPSLQGVANSPQISPDGKHLVFLQKESMWFEDEQSQVIYVEDPYNANSSLAIPTWLNNSGEFTHTAMQIRWSIDGKHFFLLAEDVGHSRLYRMPSSPTNRTVEPETLQDLDGVASFIVLPGEENHLLVVSSSLLDPEVWTLVKVGTDHREIVWSLESPMSDRRSVISELHYSGAKSVKIQGWIIKPSFFDPSQKYPLMLCIHGGPSSAWNNTWMGEMGGCWNLPLYAEQGYIVVAPNITGSSGRGQEFADRVNGRMGGDTYTDLEELMKYIDKDIDYVDMNRAVAMGISFGGYMINWIQSQPLGRRFKAFVCESGMFTLLSGYSEDITMSTLMYGGKLPEDRESLERYDPSIYLENWETPTLFIANDLDFRVPIVEGLSAFHYLQDTGVESRLLSFPDEGHITEQPANKIHWLRSALGWLNHYVDNEDGEGQIILSHPNMDPDIE